MEHVVNGRGGKRRTNLWNVIELLNTKDESESPCIYKTI
jgi:uncharacterized protein (DUF2342 family)